MKIEHIYISPGHNFVGHHGKPPGQNPTLEVGEVECVAGKGLVGDRFFGHKEDYVGQVTFFSLEAYDELCRTMQVFDKPPSAFRRNIIVSGVDLPKLVGARFSVQEVEFEGTEESAPCKWMNGAFAPGALDLLKGRGGLRARVLTSGKIRKG